MTSLLLSIIYLSFVSLGLPDALLGAAWPTMCVEFDVPVSYAGLRSVPSTGCCSYGPFLTVWEPAAWMHPSTTMLHSTMPAAI